LSLPRIIATRPPREWPPEGGKRRPKKKKKKKCENLWSLKTDSKKGFLWEHKGEESKDEGEKDE
jgi:hypothetical protein